MILPPLVFPGCSIALAYFDWADTSSGSAVVKHLTINREVEGLNPAAQSVHIFGTCIYLSVRPSVNIHHSYKKLSLSFVIMTSQNDKSK